MCGTALQGGAYKDYRRRLVQCIQTHGHNSTISIFRKRTSTAGQGYKPESVRMQHAAQETALPVNPFTDAEPLVEYMEQHGLGTVSSRTNIIRTLIKRKYIRYSGKYIVPTPKGMFTYETIRGKRIADASLTRGVGKAACRT